MKVQVGGERECPIYQVETGVNEGSLVEQLHH